MKLSQKKTCEGCRAWTGTRQGSCQLNFTNRNVSGQQWKAPIPQEPCYKPRTYDEYMTARRWQQEESSVDTLHNATI